MKMNKYWIGITAAALCMTASFSAADVSRAAFDGRDANPSVTGTQHADRAGWKARARLRAGALRWIEKLGFSTEQKTLALQQARAAQPVVEQARRDAARLLVAAHDAKKSGAPVDLRAQLHTLRQQTLTQLETLAQPVVAALSPEQRKLLTDEAAQHGRSFDEQRLVRHTAILLGRPMTAAILEARLGR